MWGQTTVAEWFANDILAVVTTMFLRLSKRDHASTRNKSDNGGGSCEDKTKGTDVALEDERWREKENWQSGEMARKGVGRMVEKGGRREGKTMVELLFALMKELCNSCQV